MSIKKRWIEGNTLEIFDLDDDQEEAETKAEKDAKVEEDKGE